VKRGLTVLVVAVAGLAACGDDESSSGWIPGGPANPDVTASSTAVATGVTTPPAPTTIPAGVVTIVVGTTTAATGAPVATTPAATDEPDADNNHDNTDNTDSTDSGDGGGEILDLGVDQDQAAQQLRESFTAIGVDLSDDQVDCVLEQVTAVGGNATDFDQMLSIYGECGIDLASIMGGG